MASSTHIKRPDPIGPYPGVVHRFSSKLVAFEHRPSSDIDMSPHTLIWIGGLGDGLLTVPYPNELAANLPPNWSLSQVILSSAYKGWGTSSIVRDADELAKFVAYLQKLRPGKKVVLMGHSTGSQDVMEYLSGSNASSRPQVQGGILQGSVSDREALVLFLPTGLYENSCKLCREMIADGRGDDILPSSATDDFFGAPVTAKRWLSLCSPNKDGEDDLFSSDLPDHRLQKIFGTLKKETPLLFLYGESDQYVPEFVDRKALVEKWSRIIKEGGGSVDEEHGGVVPGMSHNLNGDSPEIVGDLIRRVKGFLGKVEAGNN